MGDGVTNVLRANRGVAALLANMSGGGNKGNTDDGEFKKPFPPKAKILKKRQQQQYSGQMQQEMQGFDLNTTKEFSGWGDICSGDNMRPEFGYSEYSFDTGAGNRRESPSVGLKRDASEDKTKDYKVHKKDQDRDVGDNRSNEGKDSDDSGGQTQEGEGKDAGNSALFNHDKDEDVYGPKELSSWSDIVEYNDDHDKAWFEAENKRLAEKYGGTFITVKYINSHQGKVGYHCKLCQAEMNAKKSLDLHCSGMKHLKKKNMWEKGQGNLDEVVTEPDSKESKSRDESRAERRQDPPRRASVDRSRPPQGRHPPPSRDNRGNRDRPGYGGRMGPPGRDYGRHRDDDYDRRSVGSRDRYDRGEYGRRDSPYSDRRPYEDVRYARRRTPPPPSISTNQKIPTGGPVPSHDNPASGPTGTLLKQLADCEVKGEADANLATDVIAMLLKSLSDFHKKQGSTSSVHLISEAEIKFNIMKELQKVMHPGSVNLDVNRGQVQQKPEYLNVSSINEQPGNGQQSPYASMPYGYK